MRRIPLVSLLSVVLLAVLATPARAGALVIAVDRVVSPGESVEPKLRMRGGGPVQLDARRIRNAGALLDLGHDLFRVGPKLVDAAELDAAAAKDDIRIPAKKNIRAHLELADPGVYLVSVKNLLGKAHATALVTDLGLVTKRDRSSLFVWAVHRETGKPWAGVRVRLLGGAEDVTDDDGACRIDAPLRTLARVHAQSGEHQAFASLPWHASTSSDRRVYVFTHQPAYRPGETVEVKGIVRAVLDGASRLDPQATQAKVELIAMGNRVLASVPASISSDLGTFAATLALPKDAPTGEGVVRATIGGKSYEGALLIDAYRKPRFEVRVQGGEPRVFAGRPARFQVKASTYDGLPLAGAPVQWSLFWQRLDRELVEEDALTRLFFGREQEAYRPVQLQQGTGTIDARGGLAVSFDAPKDRLDGALLLRAVVQGPGGVAVAGSGRIGLANQPLYVALRTDRHVYGPEDVVQVRVTAERADGKPAADRSGVLTVGRSGARDGEEQWIHTLPFRTDARGEAVVDAPLAGAGAYVLAVAFPRVEGEIQGAPVHARHTVHATGERTTPGTRLEVTADQDVYRVGDVARLLVTTPELDTPILFTREGHTLASSRLLRIAGGAHLIEVPIQEADAPNLHLGFHAVRHGRLVSVERVLRIPPVGKRLLATIRPDRERVEPGTEIGVTIDVRDATERAAPNVEVALAVVDASIFQLHREPGAPIEAYFHPPHRNDVTTGDALAWSSVGWTTWKAPARKMAGPAGSAASPEPGAEMPMTAEDEAIEEEMHEEESDAALDDAPMEGAARGGLGGRRSRAKKDNKESAPPDETREDFRTAVWWSPTLRTDADGRVRIEQVKLGDTLTRWRFTATAVDATTRVGRSTATVTTTKAVQVEVVAPRFLLADDSVSIPLVMRNLTKEHLSGTCRFSTDTEFEAANLSQTMDGPIELAPRSTQTRRFAAGIPVPGQLRFDASLVTKQGSDRESRTIPVLPRTIPKVESHFLHARDGEVGVALSLPKHADASSIDVQVSIEPAFAQAMIAALPYLADYPYGCTEQTMSRFVPLLAAKAALAELGTGPAPRLRELPAMIQAGLDRLERLRHKDGGFGWWAQDVTDPGMTAMVVRGLTRLLALEPDNGRAKRLRSGAADALAALVAKQGMGKDLATHAHVYLALAELGRLKPEALPSPNDGAWRAAPPITRAWLLCAAIHAGRGDLVVAFRGLLDDEARRENDHVWWSPRSLGDAAPTRWQDDAIETTAAVLQALLLAGADARLLDPGYAWLIDARAGGTSWRSTRDTAAAVTAIAAYVEKTGDFGAGRRVTLAYEPPSEGLRAGERTVLFQSDPGKGSVVTVPPGAYLPERKLRLVLYCAEGRATAAVRVRYRESGPAVAAASSGFTLTRRFFMLKPAESADGVIEWRREPIAETLPTGTLVECEIVVETPERREFVMITSPHAAGFEPAGDTPIRVQGVAPATEAESQRYDDRTLFFPRRIEAGRSVFRHRLRATHVGAFTALPAQAELMYFPDTRGNSKGELWEITVGGDAGKDVR